MKCFKLCPLFFCLFLTLTVSSQVFAYYDGEIIDYDCPQYVNKGDIFTVTATVQNTGTSTWIPYFMWLEFEIDEPTYTEHWSTFRTYDEFFKPGETKTLSMDFTWHYEWADTFPEEGIFNFYIRVGYVNYVGDYYEVDHVLLTVYVGDVMSTTIESTSTSSSSTIKSTTTSTIPTNGSTTTIAESTTTTSICPSEQIYGEDTYETALLRNFRDYVLTQTPEGQEIIRLYYQWSPVIVKAMEEDEEFKEEVKEMIDGVLGLVGGEVE